MNLNKKFETSLRSKLELYQPEILNLDRLRAAVLVPIQLEPTPSILFTVRASHLNSHPGEVSFPGGMYENTDNDLVDTALRETHEEIAIEPEKCEVVGELSTAIAKNGTLVYPVVGLISQDAGPKGNPDEIADIFMVPWSYFVSQTPEMQLIQRHGIEFNIPHYYYQGHHIWGLTAMILLELVNLVEDTQWPITKFSSIKGID